MKFKKTLLAISALILAGCSTFRVGDFTVVSTKNIDLNNGKSFTIGERVKGIDRSANIAYMKNAVDRAIEQNKCAVGLSDAVLNVKQGFFTVTYIVEGNLILDRSRPGCK